MHLSQYAFVGMNDALDSSEYHDAVVVLTNSASNIDQRLGALRYLYHIVQTEERIDTFNRKRINQLILDNVLKIMMEDGASANSFKKQLIRVELFTLLSHLLRSGNLFGKEISETLLRDTEGNSKVESPSRSASSQGPRSASGRTNKTPKAHWAPSSGSVGSSSLESLSNPSVLLFGKARLGKKKSQPVIVGSASLTSLKKENFLSRSLVKDVLADAPKGKNVELSRKLKPRSAVLFNDSISKEGFVPGVDPMNFLEQDRKLGYQKPRMWFPAAMMAPSKEGLDSVRNSRQGASQVVEEYLRMRALATYVGDAVLPFDGNLSRYLPSTSLLPPNSSGDKKSSIDASRYKNAVREVMEMWTPILAAHKPERGKRRTFAFLRANQEPEPSTIKERKFQEEYVDFEEENESHMSYSRRLQNLRLVFCIDHSPRKSGALLSSFVSFIAKKKF